MEEQDFFRKALADFTHEAANGGAIRHLADLGYTVRQIAAQLDFPAPYERVQKETWERLVDTGVILLQEPGSGGRRKRAVYVREYDKYGKASFRRVSEEEQDDSRSYTPALQGRRKGEEGTAVICWKERAFDGGKACSTQELAALLDLKIAENGKESAYMSCDFGLTARREPEKYQALLDILDERQREYVSGLPWERGRVYHRMDFRMKEILMKLYGAGHYHGKCYFLKTEEIVTL